MCLGKNPPLRFDNSGRTSFSLSRSRCGRLGSRGRGFGARLEIIPELIPRTGRKNLFGAVSFSMSLVPSPLDALEGPQMISGPTSMRNCILIPRIMISARDLFPGLPEFANEAFPLSALSIPRRTQKPGRSHNWKHRKQEKAEALGVPQFVPAFSSESAPISSFP
jgi:hypothetical protein